MATAFSLDDVLAAAPLARANAVADGLPVKAVRDLVADPSITVADLARIVGPRRTLDRRLKTNAKLSPDEGDRLIRFARVLGLAVDVFGGRHKAMAWLSSSKHAFDGAVPLDLLRTEEGGRVVEEHLLRAKHGFFA